MFDVRDWRAVQAKVNEQAATDREVRRLQALAMIRKAETVTGHEGWDQFLGMLQGWLSNAKDKYAHEKESALDDPTHIVLAREARERIRTLQEVMDLIPSIVHAGKAIASTDSMT